MPDYQKMYVILFQAITRTIDILQQAQQKTEEMYIMADETVQMLFDNESGIDNNRENKI